MNNVCGESVIKKDLSEVGTDVFNLNVYFKSHII